MSESKVEIEDSDLSPVEKKKALDLISCIMWTIMSIQVLFLIYLLIPSKAVTSVSIPYISEESTPATVKHVVFISIEDGRLFEFNDVTVRKTLDEGYWIYNNNDESIHIPFRCIYLENPTENTIQKFVKGEENVQSKPSGNSGN